MTPEKLSWCISHNMNVLFIGNHGVGKSMRVIDAFNKSGLVWAYFSGPTVDPYVDLGGIPKEVDGEIEFIRPKYVNWDKVEAIYVDELNRGHKKVINSLMELIQFKSVNGIKAPNLKCVWASINPPDGDYMVEALDKAMIDRFHIHFHVPYDVDKDWFKDKFESIDNLEDVMHWWRNGVPDSVKQDISPRRLEYALQVWQKGGDIKDVLPVTVNAEELLSILEGRPDPKMGIKEIFNSGLEGSGEISRLKELISNDLDLAKYSMELAFENRKPQVLPIVPREIVSTFFPFGADKEERHQIGDRFVDLFKDTSDDDTIKILAECDNKQLFFLGMFRTARYSRVSTFCKYVISARGYSRKYCFHPDEMNSVRSQLGEEERKALETLNV